jgi:hypothetical protein
MVASVSRWSSIACIDGRTKYFDIGAMTTTMRNHLMLSPYDLMPYYHIWGGLDVWSSVDEVTLDFRAMRMTLH